MYYITKLANSFIIISALSGCQVLTLEESRTKASAQFLGCSVDQVQVSGDLNKVWTAICDEKSYYCSMRGSGTIECVETT